MTLAERLQARFRAEDEKLENAAVEMMGRIFSLVESTSRIADNPRLRDDLHNGIEMDEGRAFTDWRGKLRLSVRATEQERGAVTAALRAFLPVEDRRKFPPFQDSLDALAEDFMARLGVKLVISSGQVTFDFLDMTRARDPKDAAMAKGLLKLEVLQHAKAIRRQVAKVDPLLELAELIPDSKDARVQKGRLVYDLPSNPDMKKLGELIDRASNSDPAKWPEKDESLYAAIAAVARLNTFETENKVSLRLGEGSRFGANNRSLQLSPLQDVEVGNGYIRSPLAVSVLAIIEEEGLDVPQPEPEVEETFEPEV